MAWLKVLNLRIKSFTSQPYRDLEAGDNQSLKSYRRDRESNPGSLAPQAKNLATTPPLLRRHSASQLLVQPVHEGSPILCYERFSGRFENDSLARNRNGSFLQTQGQGQYSQPLTK